DVEKARYRQFSDAGKIMYAARHRQLRLRGAMGGEADVGRTAQTRLAHSLEHRQRGGEVARSHAGRPGPGPGSDLIRALANKGRQSSGFQFMAMIGYQVGSVERTVLERQPARVQMQLHILACAQQPLD